MAASNITFTKTASSPIFFNHSTHCEYYFLGSKSTEQFYNTKWLRQKNKVILRLSNGQWEWVEGTAWFTHCCFLSTSTGLDISWTGNPGSCCSWTCYGAFVDIWQTCQGRQSLKYKLFNLLWCIPNRDCSLVLWKLGSESTPHLFHVNTQRQILWCSGWACPLKWSYCNRLPSAVTTEPSSYHALCQAFSTHLFRSLLTIFICQIASWGSKWWQNIPHVAQIINVLARITDTRDLCHSASPGVWPPKRGLLGLRQ